MDGSWGAGQPRRRPDIPRISWELTLRPGAWKVGRLCEVTGEALGGCGRLCEALEDPERFGDSVVVQRAKAPVLGLVAVCAAVPMLVAG